MGRSVGLQRSDNQPPVEAMVILVDPYKDLEGETPTGQDSSHIYEGFVYMGIPDP